MKHRFFITVIFFLGISLIFAQSSSIPNGYRKVTLGMSLSEVKNALFRDKIFGYRGDADVSLLPSDYKQTIIETQGDTFILESWFLFNEDKLYNMAINLNPDKVDYPSVFRTLCKKYGEPDFLNPEKALWKNSSVQMSLEKPLTIKYIDVLVNEKLIADAKATESAEEILREDFLNSL